MTPGCKPFTLKNRLINKDNKAVRGAVELKVLTH